MTYPPHVRDMIESVDTKLEKGVRECMKCKDRKHEDDFYKNDLYRDGYSTRCRVCVRAYGKSWREKQKGGAE